MTPKVKLEHKKAFIKWFSENHKLRRRESLWILNYLLNHDIVLNKTRFVEHAQETPRGIRMAGENTQGRSFLFFKDGVVYEDPDKAFHEIRMNWHENLFLEIDFNEAYLSPLFIKVLEDNPYAKWNDLITAEISDIAETGLDQFQYTQREKELREEIDQALLNDDKETFLALSEELAEVEGFLKTIKDQKSLDRMN